MSTSQPLYERFGLGSFLAMRADAAEGQFRYPAPHAPRKNILVVEDELITREGLILAARTMGFNALGAANDEEALTILRSGTAVDLIVLDLSLPVMDGWEFLRVQKRDPFLASIPVLVLSGRADLASQKTALGVAAVLQKPVEFDRLCDCIRGFACQRRPGVLIVDDDAQMRALLGIALGHYGYAVWLASSGQEAVDLYRRHEEAIDVVLLDVEMPGVNGADTLAALQKVNRQVHCCFISGDPGCYPRESLLALGAAAVLEKPFGLVDVSHALREALK
jgi:CheY-like chemotaxis protein